MSKIFPFQHVINIKKIMNKIFYIPFLLLSFGIWRGLQCQVISWMSHSESAQQLLGLPLDMASWGH